MILKQEELRSMVDLAAEQNKRLINFTYIISHNIRSHVANIIGILDISEDLGDDEVALAMIQESTSSLDGTLNNLSEIISIQAYTSLPIIELNVFDEINRVVQSINVLIKEADTTIVYNFNLSLGLKTNPAYFESIVLNLITNSLKYKSPQRSLRIELDLYRQGDYWVLVFKDNGLGIDLDKYRDQIFGLYKTFHKNKDARGLGLYITKTQIEAMKGKIEVESELNAGTVFKLYFDQKLFDSSVDNPNQLL